MRTTQDVKLQNDSMSEDRIRHENNVPCVAQIQIVLS